MIFATGKGSAQKVKRGGEHYAVGEVVGSFWVVVYIISCSFRR